MEKDILDKLSWHIHHALAAVENGQTYRSQLGEWFRKARDVCRERGESFDAWCKSGEFGLSKTAIYAYMSGKGSREYNGQDVNHSEEVENVQRLNVSHSEHVNVIIAAWAAHPEQRDEFLSFIRQSQG